MGNRVLYGFESLWRVLRVHRDGSVHSRASLEVVLIWLFLMGLSRIANGTYSPSEILLTCVIAGCSAVGARNCLLLGKSPGLGGRVGMTALFAIAQVAAMWVSFLRPIGTD